MKKSDLYNLFEILQKSVAMAMMQNGNLKSIIYYDDQTGMQTKYFKNGRVVKLGEKSMSVLKAAQRNKLPKSEFGLPSERKYPLDTRGRAANAKARATQMVKKGKLSESSKEKIDAKANKILRKKK